MKKIKKTAASFMAGLLCVLLITGQLIPLAYSDETEFNEISVEESDTPEESTETDESADTDESAAPYDIDAQYDKSDNEESS